MVRGLEEQAYCSQAPWQRQASIIILSRRTPNALNIGCNWLGSGTKPASMAAHSDTSMPLKRAASSKEPLNNAELQVAYLRF